MKSRRKTFLPVIIIMIAVLSGVGFWIFQRNNRLVKQAISVNVSYDYPVTSSLEEMIEAADLIVAGRYTGLDSIWNMRRNPNDVNEEDSENYVEGHLYKFEIDDIIKGKADSNSILVNHRYSEQMSYTESNAITDEYGSIIQAATEEHEITFTASDPLFIEPETGTTYILFLLKDENFGNYYGAIEPFSIKFENSVASLQSNLIDNGNTVSQEIPVEGDRVVKLTIGGRLSVEDTISGNSYADILQRIETKERQK